RHGACAKGLWYLEHGLVVDEIYEVVEYTPARCFQGFADTVSENRRQGDLDPTKAILAETFKLLGNSAYGKSLENLENRRDVVYSRGEDVGKVVINRLFRTCTPLDHNDLFEVASAKNKVRWNLPLQIGFFVYKYAKLRMLQFHYDSVDKNSIKNTRSGSLLDPVTLIMRNLSPFVLVVRHGIRVLAVKSAALSIKGRRVYLR
ncbi:hypothetical protein ElyMa_002762000, partial [Elysia marginata]